MDTAIVLEDQFLLEKNCLNIFTKKKNIPH